MIAKNYRTTGWTRAGMFFVTLLGLLTGLSVRGASITEPSTVIYGKVLAANDGQPFQLTQGSLIWTVRSGGGPDVNLTTELFPLRSGEFSYRLNVPHVAQTTGSAPQNTIALGNGSANWKHIAITVNGEPAQILGPAENNFDVSQALRTSVHRLDLIVGMDTLDSDGDGLPDWWEDLYGDLDGTLDGDGDGWTDLDEFGNQGNPNEDDREPSIVTDEIIAYADGRTGILLRSRDADSVPAQLTYALDSVPAVGTLLRRNASEGGAGNSDSPLAVGAEFTQQEINGGLVVYQHDGSEVESGRVTFSVSLNDENPAHQTATAEVDLVLYRPAGPPLPLNSTGADQAIPFPLGLASVDQQMQANYSLSRHLGAVIWDQSHELLETDLSAPSSGLNSTAYVGDYVSRFGKDRRQVLVGGLDDDTLQGGMEDDLLIGGPGNDTLAGHGGRDVFALTSDLDGDDIIEDFSLAEGDVLDLSRLFAGLAAPLAAHFQINGAGNDSVVSVFPSGIGGTELRLTVRGQELLAADLYELVANGNLIIGEKQLPPRISITASVAVASENGPEAGYFMVHREGDLDSSLTVPLLITGSAQNGVDYRSINSTVTIPTGQSDVQIEVLPNADGSTEQAETVEVVLQAGPEYSVATADRAIVSIEDLAPRFEIGVLEALSIRNAGQRGVLLVTRSGVTDRSVLLRLEIRGSATAGVDYDSLPAYINFQPNQTTALLEVVPRSGAVLTGGVEFVQVKLKPDAGYQVGTAASASVTLVEEQIDFAGWRQRNDPDGDVTNDPGGFGFDNLQRYAFGLNAADPQAEQGAPMYSMRADRMVVEFRKPAWVADVQYVVEVTEDLLSWKSGEDVIETAVPSNVDSQFDQVSFQTTRTADDVPYQFLRVRLIYAP